MQIRIGSVPYLNAKPLVDWFHAPECDADVALTYAVPSKLAEMLRQGALDVANCSIFEGFCNPNLVLLPDFSISATGAVKSVRLFSKVPMAQIRSVALDTSSLTSVALLRILLKEVYGLNPEYQHHPPQLEAMLTHCDAGLIIGDLKLFHLGENTEVYDLGQGWFDYSGKPFVYAGWLARKESATVSMLETLQKAKAWGVNRREELAAKWASKMELPLDRCLDYLVNVMNYDLTEAHKAGLELYHKKCLEHGLVSEWHPLQIMEPK